MIKPNYTDIIDLRNLMTDRDCKELKELILSNPEAPMLILCGEESWTGEYCYESQTDMYIHLDPLTLYNNIWISKDDYEEKLRDDMADDTDYKNLSDEEFDKAVAKIVAETAFVDTICVYVG